MYGEKGPKGEDLANMADMSKEDSNIVRGLHGALEPVGLEEHQNEMPFLKGVGDAESAGVDEEAEVFLGQ